MGGIGTWGTLIMIVAVIVVFYFFGMRPQKKQEKEAQDMRNSLCVGDEITTIGGIIGKVVSIKEETMIIETGRDHTRIRFLKSAVRSVDVHAEDTRKRRQRKRKKPKRQPKTTSPQKPRSLRQNRWRSPRRNLPKPPKTTKKPNNKYKPENPLIGFNKNIWEDLLYANPE